jgi:hypothetical protein
MPDAATNAFQWLRVSSVLAIQYNESDHNNPPVN